MYTFVLLSAFVAVCAAHVPLDTPEVAIAKAAHLAAVAETQAHNLGLPVLPPPIPVVGTNPWKAYNIPTPLVAFNDGKYQHDFSGDYVHPIIPAPLTHPIPQTKYYTPSPVLVPGVKLYDDGQYHQDVAGHYIPNYVPAPLN